MKNDDELDSQVLIADILVRLSALESLLINKGCFSNEELNGEVKKLAKILAENILSKIGKKDEINNIVSSIEKSFPLKSKN